MPNHDFFPLLFAHMPNWDLLFLCLHVVGSLKWWNSFWYFFMTLTISQSHVQLFFYDLNYQSVSCPVIFYDLNYQSVSCPVIVWQDVLLGGSCNYNRSCLVRFRAVCNALGLSGRCRRNGYFHRGRFSSFSRDLRGHSWLSYCSEWQQSAVMTWMGKALWIERARAHFTGGLRVMLSFLALAPWLLVKFFSTRPNFYNFHPICELYRQKM